MVPGRMHVLRGAFGAGSFSPGGSRFLTFMRDGACPRLTTHFQEAWDELQRRVGAGMRVTARPGPLTMRDGSMRPITDAGIGRGAERLQRAITVELEQVQRDRLHIDIAALPDTDPRREAWFASGEGRGGFTMSFLGEGLV